MKSEKTLTYSRLVEVLNYVPETGTFFWKTSPAKNVKVGTIAGGKTTIRYRYIKVDERDYTAQSLAWFFVKGEWPKGPLRSTSDNKFDTRIEFLRDSGTVGPGKFDHRTAEGRSAYLKAVRKEMPERYKEQDLKKNFGIDLAQYQAKFVEQKGVCAICSKPETAMRNGKVKWLAVDHNHTTEEVRGLLCTCCNTALGKFEENIEVMESAIKYLKKYGVTSLEEPPNG